MMNAADLSDLDWEDMAAVKVFIVSALKDNTWDSDLAEQFYMHAAMIGADEEEVIAAAVEAYKKVGRKI